MSNIKPTKTQLFNGLRRRPKYEEISQEINPDKTKVIYPNRDAKFLREDPRITQLDGVGFFESMQAQEEATIKEQRIETTIRQIAMDNNTGTSNVKAAEPAKQRATEFYDIGHDDAHMHTDEEQVAQGIEQSNIHTKTRKEQMKDRTRARIIKIKTKETEVMHPGSSEMGTNTESVKAAPIETQTEPINTVTDTSINKKIKAKTKDEKVKKERKKKVVAKEAEANLKTETMQIEPEPPQTIPEIRGRARSRSPKPRGRPPKKEEVKPEPNERKRASSKVKESDEPKKARTTKSVPETKAEPKPEPKPEPKVEPKVEPKAKAKAKAKAEPKPAVIPEHDIDTDNNIDIEHWKKKGLAWIKEQLQLRGVKISNDELKTQHLDDKGKVVKDKTKAVKTKPGLKKEDLVKKVMELVTANKWIKKAKKA